MGVRIYLKEHNPFLIFSLIIVFPFILSWMAQDFIRLGFEDRLWTIQLTGIFFLLGICFEFFGLNWTKKEKKK